MAASIRKLARMTFGHRNCHCWKISCRAISQTFSEPAVTAATEKRPEKSDKTSLTQLEPWVLQGLADNSLKHRKHPGHVVLPMIALPARLADAAAVLLEKYPVKNISESASKFANYLWSRHPPASDADLSQLGQQIEEKIAAKKKKKGDETPVQRETVLRKIREKTYHWQPITYDAYKCLLYLTGRMASDYGVILQCLTEISLRLPDFVPRSIYNLGSGLGSVIWAANKIWGERVFEYYCVDKSQDMNTVARLLLQDGECQKQMHIQGVVFRQFPPSSIANKFNMVVSAYTLLEHASKEERLKTVESLWQMTEDFLVLVENGTGAGFSLINEARDHLLQMADTTNEEHLRGYIFAPCPHDLPCPRMAEKNLPCFFQIDFLHLKVNNSCKGSVRYAYIILRKGRRPEGEEWPRIVQEVVKASEHTHCHLCCADGTAQHLIITKKRYGKDLYRCTRHTSWGDRLPVNVPAPSKRE